jgi:hypothetical protein
LSGFGLPGFGTSRFAPGRIGASSKEHFAGEARMTTLNIVAIALAAFSLGVLGDRLFINLCARISGYRAKRRFIRYAQPVRYGKPPPPLAETELDGVGLSIHRVLKQQEDDCEERSLAQLPRLGEKSPLCYEMTGRVLALLDAQSSCAWACDNGDHILERLVARSTNLARAALRLTLMGFYDEALALIRSVGEIANLLSLFESKKEAFAHWKALDEKTRRREYAPFRVRDELEAIGTPIRVTIEAYAELSSRNVHVNPRTSPQTYDLIGRPKGGGYYQEAGLMICQNELAETLTFVIYSAAKLAKLEQPLKQRMMSAGRDLILNTGSLGIENIEKMWAALQTKIAEGVSSAARS